MAEYIEREKLAEDLKIWQNTLIEAYGENDEYVRCLNKVLYFVDNAPAADVRPVVRGKWKDAMQSCNDSPHVKCSVCGEYFWRYFNQFSFCPNCGADMREES